MEKDLKSNHYLALAFTILFFSTICLLCDFYYDLNDDVMLKNILSGIYTGVPDGHAIYILYPLGFLLSSLYWLQDGIPWFGIFLFCCQAGSLYLFTVRLLSFTDKLRNKLLLTLLEACLIIVLLLQHFILIQYTVTSAMLTSTAIFLFCTSNTQKTPKKFLCENIGILLLAFLSFMLRYQICLFLLPIFCIAGAYKWSLEAPVFTRQKVKKYSIFLGILLLGITCIWLLHAAAYNTTEWKEYFAYNTQRTQLYDYRMIPSYEENEAFYINIGLTRNEELLLENYNIGIDGTIDADVLRAVSAYYDTYYSDTITRTFTEILREYLYQTFSRSTYPWNVFIFLLYGAILFTMLSHRNYRSLVVLIGMFFVRSGLWLYIIYNGRTPVRLTASLSLAEFCMLAGMLLVECKTNHVRKYFKLSLAVMMAALSLLNINSCFVDLQTELPHRKVADSKLTALQTYTKQHPDAFYFVDVFSLSVYAEKLFSHTDHSASNYDLMGGWMIGSPLMSQKYALFDMESMSDALWSMENVYVIVQSPESVWRPALTDWLQTFYSERNRQVQIEKTDGIFLDGIEIFSIYTVTTAPANLESKNRK